MSNERPATAAAQAVSAKAVLIVTFLLFISLLTSARADAQGTCVASDRETLGDCIEQYNGLASGSLTIDVVNDIDLIPHLPVIPTIANGSGATLSVMSQGSTISALVPGPVPANGPHVFKIESGIVDLRQLTLTGAAAALSVSGGSVHATQITFVDNTTAFTASMSALLVVDSSTMARNRIASTAATGAMVTVRNSTFVENATAVGNFSQAEFVIEHTTIVDHTETALVGFFLSDYRLDGVVVARNQTDCSGMTIGLQLTASNSMFGDASCTGTATDGIGASLAASLDANGCDSPGCTHTIALAEDSVAVNAAGLCAITVDQRGFDRPSGGLCDIGAYEWQFPDVFCDGKLVTINLNYLPLAQGTDGPDVILGTDADDRIFGRGGDDVICAMGGVDRVNAGSGNDTIFGGDGGDFLTGGDGDDLIMGGFGVDRIRGGLGDDTLHGEGGSDRIFAGDGADEVHAGSGADRVWGGNGDDRLLGMGGKDLMYGEDGNDTMQGNFQSDQLFGGEGNDVIRGAGGKDKLYGGSGDDELYGGTNTDFLDGGEGVDVAHGQKGKDNPLVVDISGCIAETQMSC